MRRYVRKTDLCDKDRTKLDFTMSVYGPGMKEVARAANVFVAAYNRSHDHPIKGGHETLGRLDPNYADISLIEDVEKLPDVIGGMGFGEFLGSWFMERHVLKGVFGNFEAPSPTCPLFDGLDIADPSGSYHIYGGSACTMLVDKRKLDGRPVPRRWDDILDPIYAQMIVTGFNIDDINEFFPLYFYHDHGIEGVEAFAQNLSAPVDTLDIMRSTLRQDNRQAILLLPHFFACAAPHEPYLEEVWPEDGALLIPYYLLARNIGSEGVKAILSFFYSDTLAATLDGRKMFHVRSTLDETFAGRRFKWLGWDWLLSHDIIETMALIDSVITPILLERYPWLRRDVGKALWNG